MSSLKQSLEEIVYKLNPVTINGKPTPEAEEALTKILELVDEKIIGKDTPISGHAWYCLEVYLNHDACICADTHYNELRTQQRQKLTAIKGDADE